MTRPFILSASTGDSRLNQPGWARSVLSAAEHTGIDMLVLGQPDSLPFDAQVIAGWAAAASTRVGIIAAVPAVTAYPFHVARALSAVDFLCGGRSGWMPLPGGTPQGMAEDLVGAVRSLWDGWGADTLTIDKASGRYLDSSKVAPSNYSGPFFRVAGPVNAMRPPQGHLVLVVDGADPVASPGADIALVSEGQTLPAARKLLKVSLDADPQALSARFAEGEIDGVHFTLTEPEAELPQISARFGYLAPSRTGKTLRERLGLAVPVKEFA